MKKKYIKPNILVDICVNHSMLAGSNVGGEPINTSNNDYISGGGSSNSPDAKRGYFDDVENLDEE